MNEADPPGGHPDDGRLQSWRARRLPEPDAAAVAAHLTACAACRDLLAELALPVPAETRRRALAAFPQSQVRRRMTLRVAAGVGALAAAAGLVAIVWQGGQGRRGGEPVPWPVHALEGPTGGLREVRSTTKASRRFDANSRFELVLRPLVPAKKGAMPVAAFTARQGGPLAAVPTECLIREPNGIALVSCPARRILGQGPGPYTVLIVGGLAAAETPTLIGLPRDAALGRLAGLPIWEVSAVLLGPDSAGDPHE